MPTVSMLCLAFCACASLVSAARPPVFDGEMESITIRNMGGRDGMSVLQEKEAVSFGSRGTMQQQAALNRNYPCGSGPDQLIAKEHCIRLCIGNANCRFSMLELSSSVTDHVKCDPTKVLSCTGTPEAPMTCSAAAKAYKDTSTGNACVYGGGEVSKWREEEDWPVVRKILQDVVRGKTVDAKGKEMDLPADQAITTRQDAFNLAKDVHFACENVPMRERIWTTLSRGSKSEAAQDKALMQQFVALLPDTFRAEQGLNNTSKDFSYCVPGEGESKYGLEDTQTKWSWSKSSICECSNACLQSFGYNPKDATWNMGSLQRAKMSHMTNDEVISHCEHVQCVRAHKEHCLENLFQADFPKLADKLALSGGQASSLTRNMGQSARYNFHRMQDEVMLNRLNPWHVERPDPDESDEIYNDADEKDQKRREADPNFYFYFNGACKPLAKNTYCGDDKKCAWVCTGDSPLTSLCQNYERVFRCVTTDHTKLHNGVRHVLGVVEYAKWLRGQEI